MRRNRRLSEVCPGRLVAGILFLATGSARALVLDSSGYPAPPPPPEVNCTLSQDGVTVTSFAGILGYQLKGTCTVKFPGSLIPSVPSAPYEGGGSWNSDTGQVNEYLRGRDAKGQQWEITGGGNCHLDPWMVGRAGASCSGKIANATANSPANILKSLAVPISADLLDSQARAWLTGKTLAAMKAESQAPTITKPAEAANLRGTVNLAIDPGPGSPTKTFALEWQAKVGGVWVNKNVDDQVGFTAALAGSKFGIEGPWRVRARAHQAPKAFWSNWRSFNWQSGIMLGSPPGGCTPSKPVDAQYTVSATPATIKAGSSTKVSITVKNTGSTKWTVAGNFHLSYHWATGGVVAIFDGVRTSLPNDVASCASFTVNADLTAPAAPGPYTVQWDMVQEGVTWFSSTGVPTGNKNVTVTP